MVFNFIFFFNSILFGIGLAMDAFSVSVANGLREPDISVSRSLAIAGTFAVFQTVMPLLGWLLGVQFQSYITAVDHWIAFGLLALIGGNMIRESFSPEEKADPSLGILAMLPLAVATSIDALAVGVTFAFLEVRILPAVSFIGVITFLLSALGVKIGSIFGTKYKSKAELLGGIILILLGIKILLEHLGYLPF